MIFTIDEMNRYMCGKHVHNKKMQRNHNYIKKRNFLRRVMKNYAKQGYGGIMVRPHLINMGDVYELYESGFDVRELKDGRIHIRWY